MNASQASAIWWNDGHAVRTRMFDALSLMFPTGEQFLLDTAGEWQTRGPESPAHLRTEVHDFIADEKAHQRAHRLYNQRLAQAGLPAQALEQRVQNAVASLADLPLGTRLALACAFEHLNAVFAREVLHSGVWLTERLNPQSRLWRWHCQEELAHKDVIFNLLPGAGVPRCTRAAAMLLGGFYLTSDMLGLMHELCLHDVRSGRITRAGLGWQLVGLAVRGTPSVLRMAWRSCGVLWQALR